MSRLSLIITALVSVAAARQVIGQTAEPMLRAGSARLVPFLPSIPAETIGVFVRSKGDSTERRMSTLIRTERPMPGDPGRTIVTSVWSAPYDSRDSLVVDRTLAPVAEELFFNRVLRKYQYRDRQITGSMEQAGAAPVPYAVDFPETPMAFNEVELLVRALDYAPGLQVVAPLFSEVDKAIEHDTLTVLRRGAPAGGAGDSTWVVRFADPVITTIYAVDPKARRIVDAVTTNRASGTSIYYRRR